MNILTADEISCSTNRELFSGVSFVLDHGDRLGVVGANGMGKSTLLKCLAGLIEPSSGVIRVTRGLKIVFVAQAVSNELLALTVREFLLSAFPPEEVPYSDWRVEYELENFEVPKLYHDTSLNALSGGWLRLVYLAHAILQDPDLLILDEPTNDVDIENLVRLERKVSQLKGLTLVVCSHDRMFLERCADKTFFLREKGSRYYQCSYSRAKSLLEHDLTSEANERQKANREVARLRKTAHELYLTGRNNFSDTALKKSAMIDKRASQIEAALTGTVSEKRASLSIGTSRLRSKSILRFEDIKISQGETHLFAIGSLRIHPTDRIILLGQNGCGKSTFLKYMADGLKSGDTFSFNEKLSYFYIDQQLSSIDSTLSLVSVVSKYLPSEPDKIVKLLVSAGFPYSHHSQAFNTLSLGEKKRIALSIAGSLQPNLLILDEPTNHIDIDGREQLEAHLSQASGASIVVTHDRYFAENIGSRYFMINSGFIFEIESSSEFFNACNDSTQLAKLVKKYPRL